MSDTTIAVCETCGMPVKVVFDDDGEIEQVFAVCGHVSQPEPVRTKLEAGLAGREPESG